MKRVLYTALVILIAILIAVVFYVRPRRIVPSIWGLVPPRDMVACVNVRKAGGPLRKLTESAFVRKVGGGEIFPLSGLKKAGVDREFIDDLETDYWPELFGRDFVFAMFLAGDKGKPAFAAFSRIGYRTRLFHLWQMIRYWLLFRGKPEIRREGGDGFTVTRVVDDGEVRFSYAIAGDLGIATIGTGEDLWPLIRALYSGGARKTKPPEKIFNGESNHPEVPDGALYVDVASLCRWAGSALGGIEKFSDRGVEVIEACRNRLQGISRKWDRLEGRFTIGENSTGRFFFYRQRRYPFDKGQTPLRDPQEDRLAAVMDEGGLMYAASCAGLKRRLENLLKERFAGGLRVELQRDSQMAEFLSDHPIPLWLGEDFSTVINRREIGVIDAAMSLSVSDVDAARESLQRFLNSARDARLVLRDGNGREILSMDGGISLRRKRIGEKTFFTVRSDEAFSKFYLPAVCLAGDRLLFTTSEALMERILSGSEAPPERWAQPSSFQFIIRGDEAQRAASSMKYLLAIGSIFARKGKEAERLEAASRYLGFFDWLEPLREGRVTGTAEGGAVRLEASAEFKDIEK